MPNEFEEKPLKTTHVVLEVAHIDFLKTVKNASKYLRWLVDNDPRYKNHKKEKNGKK